MDFTSNYKNFRQNAYKKKKTTGDEFTDEFINALDDEHYRQYEELAPVKKQTQTAKSDIAPTRQTATETKEKKNVFDRVGDALSDGYDFGDVSKAILGITDDSASLYDLTIGSAKRGYYNALYGEESYNEMTGQANEKDKYEKILAGEEYQFTPGSDFAGGVSGAFEMLGQNFRNWTNPITLGSVGTAVGIAALAGNAGPQALVPEEVITIPTAVGAGLAAGGAANAFKIEAGLSYNELLEAGVSKETASKVAMAVGGVNAGLELLQIDELVGAFKILNKSGATESVAKRIGKELLDRGIDVAKETAQEVAQEGVTIAGTQIGSKIDNGEWAYNAGEVTDRLGDTAKSSALSFGIMNGPAAIRNSYSIVKDGKNANKTTTVTEEQKKDEPVTEPPTPEKNVFQNEMGKLAAENTIPKETTVAEKSQKEYVSLEDFANRDSSVWQNVDYNDKATQASIMQNTHNTMVTDGSVVKVSEDAEKNVEQSYPDLRGIKKQERTPILKKAMNKLKTNLRQFLSGFKNQNFEFEVNGKVLEARLYSTGINEVLEKVTKEKANMLYATEDIFRNARYLYSTPDYDGNPNVYRWNYFYTPVQIGENIVGVRIAVRDVMQGQDHQPESQIYNWGIKKDASLSGAQPVVSDSSHVASSDASDDIIPQNSKMSSGSVKKSLSSENEASVRDKGRTPLSDMRLETTEDIAPTQVELAPAQVAVQTTQDSAQDSTQVAPAVEETYPEDLAPAKETAKPAEKVKNEQKIAKVLIEEPAKEQKPSRTLSQARNLTVDKHSAIEDLSLKTGNKELMAKADYLHRAENAAQRFINKGADGNKSINDLRKEVKKSGLIQEFSDYMYHALNIDRMSLKDKADAKIAELSEKFGNLKTEQIQAIAAEPITAKTTPKRAQTIKEAREYSNALGVKNKPVFGESVTADMSRTEVKIAENKHPIFKKWADEIYAINNHLKKMMVDSGVISQATSDLFAEMYPHYIPTRRVDKNGNAINVPLDTNKTGVNAPIKRATGGNSGIGNLFNTLAMRAEQTYKAVAKNSLGIELKNALGVQGTKQTTTVDEINDSFEKSDELLKKGEDGMKPTFTVFENGERVEFEISEDIYDALKPTNEFLAKSIPVLSTLSKIQRAILTQYNLLFSATNAIKDAQSVLINSKHAIKTYKNMPKAALDLASKQLTGTESTYLKEYLEHGGEDTKVFDNTKGEFVKEPNKIQKALGFLPDKISKLNNFIESIPRYAEYIASRESGASIEKAMLDAARVTTNFAAGGDLAKFANRNGFTFLNASIQGANQQARNVREAIAEGKKGVLVLAGKYAVAGLPILLFNHLMWGDDEEYEELSDYVKDNYYIVGKLGDTFVRIPKGREVAVIQNAFEQMKNAITGDDEVDIRRFAELLVENLAPQNPLDNNVFAPLVQTHTNKTWYGEELVPTRLQDLPNAEQYDESTDVLSKWLGETFNLSPYRVNYLLDQVSGGVGDVVLPMLTPKADGGDDSLIGNAIAPWKDKFTTNATTNNQNVSDFYDKIDELTKNANSSKATDADTLKYKYMSAINSDLSKLYQQKREIQNSDKSASEKHELSMQIQQQIVDTMRDALSSYENVSIQGSYATVGDLHYRWHVPDEDSTAEPSWQKITDKQLAKQNEVTSALGISASEYWSKKEEYEYAYEQPQKYQIAKAVGGFDTYRSYTKTLNDIKADKDALGDTISGSRQKKVVEYINSLDADYGTKLILYRSEYKSDDRYNRQIVEYLNSRNDISRYQMTVILTELGFTVHSDGRVTWD